MNVKEINLFKILFLSVFLYIDISRCLESISEGKLGYGDFSHMDSVKRSTTLEDSKNEIDVKNLKRNFIKFFLSNSMNENENDPTHRPFMENDSILIKKRIIPKSKDVCSSIQLMSFWRLYSKVIEYVFHQVFPEGHISEKFLKNSDTNVMINLDDIKELSSSEILTSEILENINELKSQKDKNNESSIVLNSENSNNEVENNKTTQDIFYDAIPSNFTKESFQSCHYDVNKHESEVKETKKEKVYNKTNVNNVRISNNRRRILFGFQNYYPLN